MNLLVTGGCGYIGSVLVPKILESGYFVTVVDTMWFGNALQSHKKLRVIKADIRDMDAIPLSNIDTVIHLANIANDPCGALNAKLSWEVNVLAGMQLIEKAVRSGVKQFIYSSSGSVYGIKKERAVTEDLPLYPLSDYNKTKMAAERVFLSYKDHIAVQCIRPATVCGLSPRMRLDVSVNLLSMKALTKGIIPVFGGEQYRPNIHIQDISDVFIHFIGKVNSDTGVFNAGFENLSILQIAETVSSLIPSRIKRQETVDKRSYRLNSDKLLNTGFRPKWGVTTAIREIKGAYNEGVIKDEENGYNIKTLKRILEKSTVGVDLE